MAKAISTGIVVEGTKQLSKALRVLGEGDAPFIRAALTDAGMLLRSAAAHRTHGGIASAIAFVGVMGKANSLRAVIKIKHPGAKSMEFGRSRYYTGYRGRAVKSGRLVTYAPPRGQRARPYLGVIKGNGAVGEVRERVETMLRAAFEKEWERIGAGSGD